MNPLKIAIGLILAFGLGFVCRVFTIPAPAPAALTGALLVMAVTLGYLSADKLITSKNPPPALTPATSQPQSTQPPSTLRTDTTPPRSSD